MIYEFLGSILEIERCVERCAFFYVSKQLNDKRLLAAAQGQYASLPAEAGRQDSTFKVKG